MIDPAYFDRKRQQLGMQRQTVLEQVQLILDEWYPGRARARQLHHGVLRVITTSSSVASELRMRQRELLDRLGDDGVEVRLAISISDLN